MKQRIQLTESQLKQIINESVKNVLNELFDKVIPINNVIAQLQPIAQKNGYFLVGVANGKLLLKNSNGEKIYANFLLPKTKSTGMMGTGVQGWTQKDIQTISQQLSGYFSRLASYRSEANMDRYDTDAKYYQKKALNYGINTNGMDPQEIQKAVYDYEVNQERQRTSKMNASYKPQYSTPYNSNSMDYMGNNPLKN